MEIGNVPTLPNDAFVEATALIEKALAEVRNVEDMPEEVPDAISLHVCGTHAKRVNVMSSLAVDPQA